MTTQDTDIPEGWTSASLGQIGKVITGKTPSRDNPDDWGEIMDFITPSDIRSEQKFIDNVSRKLSEKGISNFRRIHIPKNSLIITCIGSDMGKVVINKNNCITNQQINSLIVGNGYDNDFVYYKLKNSYQILRSHADGGSTMPILNKTQFEILSFIFPSLSEQKEIASILSSFDNKIELLRTQNETLEKTAQTIFQEWFGKYSVDDDLPEGWRFGKLGEIYKTTSGGTPSRSKPEYYGNDYLWIKSKELENIFVIDTEEKISEEGLKNSSAKLLKKNTILVAMYGATVGQMSILGVENATCNQAICGIMEIDYSYSYIYFYLISNKNSWVSLANGAAQQNLSQIVLSNLDIIIPPIYLVNEFHDIANVTLQKILSNLLQIQSLTKARDTLLPKLMKEGINGFNA